MLDLEPATRALATLVEGVRDDQLTARTPCTESTLADLLDQPSSVVHRSSLIVCRRVSRAREASPRTVPGVTPSALPASSLE
jgi:hypothetical protein